jgi:hypothetical protein
MSERVAAGHREQYRAAVNVRVVSPLLERSLGDVSFQPRASARASQRLSEFLFQVIGKDSRRGEPHLRRQGQCPSGIARRGLRHVRRRRWEHRERALIASTTRWTAVGDSTGKASLTGVSTPIYLAATLRSSDAQASATSRFASPGPKVAQPP